MIWIDGEEKIEIEIGKIANQRDMSKIEPSKRPLLNPSLELSGIYFMQELRRPVKQEEHKNIRELEEELIANLRKAEFLIAINAEQEEDGKLHIPYLKIKRIRSCSLCLQMLWNLRNLEEARISVLRK